MNNDKVPNILYVILGFLVLITVNLVVLNINHMKQEDKFKQRLTSFFDSYEFVIYEED